MAVPVGVLVDVGVRVFVVGVEVLVGVAVFVAVGVDGAVAVDIGSEENPLVSNGKNTCGEDRSLSPPAESTQVDLSPKIEIARKVIAISIINARLVFICSYRLDQLLTINMDKQDTHARRPRHAIETNVMSQP